MAVERKFVQTGFVKASMNEYFAKQLDRAGYGGMELNRTPMGTQITIYSEKPGMVIGKGGKIIKRLTRDINRLYSIESPQIDVQQVKKPEMNAQMMATRLASSIERGWYFRKAGHNTLRAIMGAGALGCEIVISGKLTGSRSRVEKMVDGYIKHAGKFAEDNVDAGFAVAIKKLGTLGCMVRIIPPDVTLPDKYELKTVVETEEDIVEKSDAELKKAIDKKPLPKKQEESIKKSKPDPIEELIESEPTTDEVADEEEIEEPISDAEDKTDDSEDEKKTTREVDGTHQHKHEKHGYWHPVARVHKEN